MTRQRERGRKRRRELFEVNYPLLIYIQRPKLGTFYSKKSEREREKSIENKTIAKETQTQRERQERNREREAEREAGKKIYRKGDRQGS